MNTAQLNTAILRRLASDAAATLDWTRAAALYDEAVNVYPPTPGELAKRDLAMLRQRATECRSMVQP